MGESARDLLLRLLARGDRIAVQYGRLYIDSAKGLPVPPEWRARHEYTLIAAAARIVGVEALRYESKSVGNYEGGRAPGVTLQLENLTGDRSRYVIFNVFTRRERAREGKWNAGDPLPKGRFRIGKKSEFLKFWQRLGLEKLKNRSDYWQYLGRLKNIVLTGDLLIGDKGDGERIVATSLTALHLTHDQIAGALLNPSTAKQQVGDRDAAGIRQVNPTGKESTQAQISCGIATIPTTGPQNYGKKVIGEHGKKGIPKTPMEQTDEEWLKEFIGDELICN